MDMNDKPNLELRDVCVEYELKPRFSHSFGKPGTRWYAPVSLKIYDLNRKQFVAEWFYLFICSPEFLVKPVRKIMPDMKFTIVQPQLDLNAIRIEAVERFKRVSPDNWDDFYIQMREYFAVEDE